MKLSAESSPILLQEVRASDVKIAADIINLFCIMVKWIFCVSVYCAAKIRIILRYTVLFPSKLKRCEEIKLF